MFILEQATKAQRSGAEVYICSFFNLGVRQWWVVNVTLRLLYAWERDLVSIVQWAGCVPEPVWTSAKNIAPNGIRYPDRPSRSGSLPRPAGLWYNNNNNNNNFILATIMTENRLF